MECNQEMVMPNDCEGKESEMLQDKRMDTVKSEPPTRESRQKFNVQFLSSISLSKSLIDCFFIGSQLKRAYHDHDDTDAPEMEPQKKLCRFYYLDHCMKADNCSFMHSEFPCKFYYFGYECKDGKNCKLLHGSALDSDMKQALWLHVMSAPANLLQRFPCFPRVLLKQNFDDRHNELIQMEQEGLLEDDEPCLGKESVFDPVSSTLLSEVIKTASKTQVMGDALTKLGELVEILTTEQIALLASIGVETMDQLFLMGASSLLELGFDFDTLIKIGNYKEKQRKQSIYTTEIDEENQNDIVCSPDSKMCFVNGNILILAHF